MSSSSSRRRVGGARCRSTSAASLRGGKWLGGLCCELGSAPGTGNMLMPLRHAMQCHAPRGHYAFPEHAPAPAHSMDTQTPSSRPTYWQAPAVQQLQPRQYFLPRLLLQLLSRLDAPLQQLQRSGGRRDDSPTWQAARHAGQAAWKLESRWAPPAWLLPPPLHISTGRASRPLPHPQLQHGTQRAACLSQPSTHLQHLLINVFPVLRNRLLHPLPRLHDGQQRLRLPAGRWVCGEGGPPARHAAGCQALRRSGACNLCHYASRGERHTQCHHALAGHGPAHLLATGGGTSSSSTAAPAAPAACPSRSSRI